MNKSERRAYAAQQAEDAALYGVAVTKDEMYEYIFTAATSGRRGK
jgi:hypothetical protein